jgi:hypothetical protein
MDNDKHEVNLDKSETEYNYEDWLAYVAMYSHKDLALVLLQRRKMFDSYQGFVVQHNSRLDTIPDALDYIIELILTLQEKLWERSFDEDGKMLVSRHATFSQYNDVIKLITQMKNDVDKDSE